ncbi:MAG: hypothetical protein HXY43_07290 [Fischerella sp.]|nr:hypothetical protein [Fischerella sp.]
MLRNINMLETLTNDPYGFANSEWGNHGALCADAGSAPAPPQDLAGSPMTNDDLN